VLNERERGQTLLDTLLTIAAVLIAVGIATAALRALTAIAIERKDHKRAWELHRQLTALGDRPVELSYNLGLLLQSAGEPRLVGECLSSIHI